MSDTTASRRTSRTGDTAANQRSTTERLDQAMPHWGAPWYLYLVTGLLWIMVAWVVLRFDLTSVAAAATLAGLVLLFAAAAEVVQALTAVGWRWLHAILSVLFAIAAIVVLARPGGTFVWLAAFVGWYLLIKGFFDVIMGFAIKRDSETWWLLVLLGVIEVLLGFWAAGQWVRSAFLLVVLVGAIALSRGIFDLVMAFRVRQLSRSGTPPAVSTGPNPAG